MHEGDTILVDIPNNRLELKVSEEELAGRRAAWTPKKPKITEGYLGRYQALVTSGNRGAILELPKELQN